MLAAGKGYAEAVALLLEHGAKIDTQDNAGRTALMYAAKNGHTEAVALLLKKGGKTETVKTIKFGAKFDVRDIFDRTTPKFIFKPTALTYAAESGHTEIVALLLEYGAKIDA